MHANFESSFRSMQRIIFLNRFFFPDHSATSQILSDLAFHLSASGHHVHVVTSQQRYGDPEARLPAEETVRGVHIHRVATTRFGRSALAGRGLDYLSFYVSMRRCVLALAGPGDIVVAKTDPPLLCVLAMQAARRRGARLVNWLQDLYPEVAIQLGVPMLRGPVGRGVTYLRDRSLTAADANVVPGESMAARVLSRGAAPERVHIIPNWADDESIVPVPHAENPLRRDWGLEGKFVIGYSGNLGRAHEFDTVLGAAERLREHAHVVFVFIGGGHQFDELARRVAKRDLDRTVRFFPYQDHAALKYSLSAADLHWVSLRPEMEGLIFPSKFYGIAAAGRPVIAIAAKDSEIARLVLRHDCGIVIEPGNAEALAEALLLLSADAKRRAAMGASARAMLDVNFTRRHGFAHWLRMLENVATPEEAGATTA